METLLDDVHESLETTQRLSCPREGGSMGIASKTHEFVDNFDRATEEFLNSAVKTRMSMVFQRTRHGT